MTNNRKGYNKQYKSLEKAGKEIGIESQKRIYLWIDVKDIEIVED